MSEPVAVVTPFPALRRGLAAMLAGSEFEPEEPADPVAWLAATDHRIVLLAFEDPGDVEIVVDLRRADCSVVAVALLPETTPAIVRGALLAGACSVARWDASLDELLTMLEAGVGARSVLPTSVVHQLAIGNGSDGHQVPLDRDQIDWLRALARGITVTELAERISYSEREAYRLLRGLYDRLGVGNRTEALVWAARRGILD